MKKPAHVFLALLLIATTFLMFARRGPEPGESTGDRDLHPPLATGVDDAVLLQGFAKDRIAAEVIAGRRTLLAAAALFRELNRLPPEPLKLTGFDPSLTMPADTEEGYLCLLVAERVSAALEGDPVRTAVGLAKLDAEFEGQLCKYGVVRLPDASALTPVQELLNAARLRLVEYQRPTDEHGP